MAVDSQTAAIIRNLHTQVQQLRAGQAQLVSAINAMNSRPRSVQEEIDAEPGRRIEGMLSGAITFTAADVGRRAAPITFLVSQDGPFIMTHYPMAVWRPTAPSNATNLNRWRPVSTYPLPVQVVDEDIIDILYELNDGGSQRFGQNQPRGPVLSRPDNIVPCPIPTAWSSNSTIVFQPTYLALTWNAQTPPTEGTLHVDLIGYRIANM